MKTIFRIFTLKLLLLSVTVWGQKENSPRVKNLFLKANAYRSHFDYYRAIDNYKRILSYTKDNQEAMVNIADCYYKLKDYPQTLLWYDTALYYGKFYPPHGFQYASVLINQGLNEKARSWLKSYLEYEPGDQRAREKLESLENRTVFYRDSSQYMVKSIPVNTASPEFSPVLYQNGFIFVSAREMEKNGKSKARKKNNPYLDLFYYDLKKQDSSTVPLPLTNKINSELHEGPLAIYDHESKMIFTRNNKTKNQKMNDVNVIHFQLFYSEKDDKGEWKEPTLLPINDEQYSMGHPTVTEDGKTLYFVSTIPGGFGGSDIYRSRWNATTWGKPENLGQEINTPGNEMFPYIYKDSILYFSSDGYKGLGGLDIFKARIAPPHDIRNMGYPINSSQDDFAIVFYPEGNKGFFSSNRELGKGNDDIYEFTIRPGAVTVPEPSEKPPIPTPVVTVYYTIQILALEKPQLVPRGFLKQLKGVIKHDGKDGLHRYTYGEYKGAEDAFEMLEKIRAMGYSDAFIRRVEKYAELSQAPGENVDLLYEKMGRIPK